MNCLKKIREAIENLEIARSSKNAYTVTKIARSLASSRSHGVGADRGRKVHNFWGDPFEIARNSEYLCPFPLACKINDCWIYGYADLIRFCNCKPVEVIEVKSYSGYCRYDEIQVIIYAFLAYKLFRLKSKPKAFLVLGWDGRNFVAKQLVSWEPDKVFSMIIQAINKNIK